MRELASNIIRYVIACFVAYLLVRAYGQGIVWGFLLGVFVMYPERDKSR